MNSFLRFLLRVLDIIKFMKIVLFISTIMENWKSIIPNAIIETFQQTGKAIQAAQQNWLSNNSSYRTEEKAVPLLPVEFDIDQPAYSEVKFNEDRSIATRIGENFQYAYVNLEKSLTPYEFILIQILKADRQLAGGPRLYLEHGSGGRISLFVDSSCKPYDYIIFWIDKKGESFCRKGERTHSLGKINPCEVEHYKLVCEMYGPVQQIRAYKGYLNLERRNDSSCSNDSPEVSENDSSVPCSDLVPTSENSNLQHACPEEPKSNISLSLKISVPFKYSFVEEITVNNLPTNSQSTSDLSATCSDNETSNDANEICQICMDANADTIIIPCGHLICCFECASRIVTRCGTQCPICRTEIKNCHRVYSRIPKCRDCTFNSANIVLLPCGDMCLCDSCSTDAAQCPICKMFVNSSQKVIYV